MTDREWGDTAKRLIDQWVEKTAASHDGVAHAAAGALDRHLAKRPQFHSISQRRPYDALDRDCQPG